MTEITPQTRIHDLLAEYPFLEDFLANYNSRFEMLRNRMARATIGRVATLRTVAGIANIDLAELLEDLVAEIERCTGAQPGLEHPLDGSGMNRQQRLATLKEIISDLHEGGDLDIARRRFAEAVEDVEASEIAEMEEELIRGGLPVSEVQRLCDVHIGAFREALDQHTELDAPAGHPVHTYMAGNRVIEQLADQITAVIRSAGTGPEAGYRLQQAGELLERLSGIENHYQRKENQLFPLLERHNVTGPSRVMWGVHNEIREHFKTVREAVVREDTAALTEHTPSLIRAIVEMIYKEEKILFPLALDTLSEDEWAEVRRGEDELGYVLAHPAAEWPGPGEPAPQPASQSPVLSRVLLNLGTGTLAPEEIDLILRHLPFDMTFVDEADKVRYYSEGPERIFPRTPAVIGRSVQNCHPPSSVHVVNRILQAFRSGERDVAEFWIEIQGSFVYIRYFAVRDEAGAYRGCLEVMQNVTGIRALEGERRLLDWE